MPEVDGDALAQQRAQRAYEIEQEAKASGKLPTPVEQEEYWSAREADETAGNDALANVAKLEQQANEQRRSVEEEKAQEFENMRQQILEQQGEQPAADGDAPQNLDTHSRGKPEAGGGAEATAVTAGKGGRAVTGKGTTTRSR